MTSLRLLLFVWLAAMAAGQCPEPFATEPPSPGFVWNGNESRPGVVFQLKLLPLTGKLLIIASPNRLPKNVSDQPFVVDLVNKIFTKDAGVTLKEWSEAMELEPVVPVNGAWKVGEYTASFVVGDKLELKVEGPLCSKPPFLVVDSSTMPNPIGTAKEESEEVVRHVRAFHYTDSGVVIVVPAEKSGQRVVVLRLRGGVR